MGTIHASRKIQEEPNVVTHEEDCIPCREPQDKAPGNPGSFEEIHKKVKDLYPQNFEGA